MPPNPGTQMMPWNPNPNRGALGFMRVVLILGVIICMAFPTMALGQSTGDKYVGQQTQKDQCAPKETPGPLSCPYPPRTYPISDEGMIVDPLPAYQGNLKEDPNDYYHAGKAPAKPAVPKGE